MSSALVLENQIYGDYKEKKLPTSQDSLLLCDLLTEDVVKDIVLDSSRIVNVVFENIFKAKSGKSKAGRYLKLFILTQWALPFLPVVLKARSWKIVSEANKTGTDDRFFFLDNDVETYFNKRNVWIEQASIAGIEFLTMLKFPSLD